MLAIPTEMGMSYFAPFIETEKDILKEAKDELRKTKNSDHIAHVSLNKGMPSTNGINVLTKMVEKIEKNQQRMETSVEVLRVANTPMNLWEQVRLKGTLTRWIQAIQRCLEKGVTMKTKSEKGLWMKVEQKVREGQCSLNSTPRMLKNMQPAFGKIKDRPQMAKIVGKIPSNDRLSNMKENRPTARIILKHLNTTKEGLGMKRSNVKEYREVTLVSTGIWIDALRGKVVPPRKDKENSSS
ncbi:protein Ycf2-like [Cucumis melo var. makuwa]|uniref:Protein Ycf2-like n=1 Tax=Cucumis melo var. makuwa TaxID=1194695 RepID=A0A5D3CHA4_CUCMM|nr:protein Ycf2-like [Cucumis melo var. makuwa]